MVTGSPASMGLRLANAACWFGSANLPSRPKGPGSSSKSVMHLYFATISSYLSLHFRSAGTWLLAILLLLLIDARLGIYLKIRSLVVSLTTG